MMTPFFTCEKINETSSWMVLKLQVNIWASICTLLRLDLRRLCWTGLERFRISSNVNKKRITRSLNKTGFRSWEPFKMNTNCNFKDKVQFATCTMQEARCNLQSLQVIRRLVFLLGRGHGGLCVLLRL